MNYFPDMIYIGIQEIPGEVSLIVPLAGCSHKCIECHSPFLQNKGGGKRLNKNFLESLYKKYKNKITCVLFFGGEHEKETLIELIEQAKYFGYKTALYSGFYRGELPSVFIDTFDYIKTGPYIKEYGGLMSKNTNQKLYHREEDISWKFLEV